MMQHITNETLIDYIHGALKPDMDAAVYAHLEQCAACSAEHAQEVSLSELLRTHAAANELELPSSVKAAIWQEIRDARPSFAQRLTSMLRPRIAVPVAAVLAIAAYFGSTQLGGAAPTIDAAYYLQDHAALNSTVPFSERNVNPVDLESGASVSALTGQTAVNVQAASYTADASQ